jgi:hypothetical protein
MATGAADQRTQSSQQFFHVERLGQVVVGTGVDAGHLLVPAVARGEDQHRHRAAGGPPLAQHGDAVELRQAEVEHHGVVGFAVAQVVGVDAVARGIDRVAGRARPSASCACRVGSSSTIRMRISCSCAVVTAALASCRSCSCPAPLRPCLTDECCQSRASTLSLTSAPPLRSSLIS